MRLTNKTLYKSIDTSTTQRTTKFKITNEPNQKVKGHASLRYSPQPGLYKYQYVPEPSELPNETLRMSSNNKFSEINNPHINN